VLNRFIPSAARRCWKIACSYAGAGARRQAGLRPISRPLAGGSRGRRRRGRSGKPRAEPGLAFWRPPRRAA